MTRPRARLAAIPLFFPVALAAAAQTPPAPDRLAVRRCAAMPDDATYQACLERAARTIDRFRKAERGAR